MITVTIPAVLAILAAVGALLQMAFNTEQPALLWRDQTTWEKVKGKVAIIAGIVAILAGAASGIMQL